MAETLRIAKSIGAPVVGTNDSHYLESGHARAHEALLCIQTGTNLQRHRAASGSRRRSSTSSRPRRWRGSSPRSPRPARNTLAVAERCNLTLEFNQFHLPRYVVPASTRSTAICTSWPTPGLRRRYGPTPGDAIEDAARPRAGRHREDGIRGLLPGGVGLHPLRARSRGSRSAPDAARPPARWPRTASGITNVDPMRYGLLFERFLNPERISMPDMDIDFADDRRDEVIRYVAERYGRDRVAHIITFGTLGAKAAIRDVGRVLGMAYGDVDRIAKLVPNFPLNITLDDAYQKSLPLAEVVRSQPTVKEMWEIARTLEGCTRHASVHASAVVISDEPLEEHIPLYKDPKRPELITGFAMGPIEKLGLLKMDFLGLRTLTVLANTVALIKESRGIDHRPRRAAARRREDVRDALRGEDVRRVPARVVRACATPCAGSGPSGWKTSSPWSRSTGPARWSSSPTSSSASTAGPRSRTSIPRWRSSRGRRTGSWCTKSRSCRSPPRWRASPWARPTSSAAPWARRTASSWPSSARSSSAAAASAAPPPPRPSASGS